MLAFRQLAFRFPQNSVRCLSTTSRCLIEEHAEIKKPENEPSKEEPKINFSNEIIQEERKHQKSPQAQLEDYYANYRFVYPEFLPEPNALHRNKLTEKLERIDMLKRRSNIEIPEFYPGSILRVNVSDKHAPGKVNVFVGICIQRSGHGLRAGFILRNHVDGEGVEIAYELYNPCIQSITVLKLEKRLDDDLIYLRDCPPEYSTFPFDTPEELIDPDKQVPINPIKVPLNEKPWCRKWQYWNLKGIIYDFEANFKTNLYGVQWEKDRYDEWYKTTGQDTRRFDLMEIYRKTIPAEEQTEIFSEVNSQLIKLTQTLRKQKRKRTFKRPEKTI